MTELGDPSRFDFVPGAGGPLVVRGEGSYLVTADGRRILDAAGGAIVANVGHGRTEVATAVSAAMQDLGYVLPMWPTPNRLRLVDRLRSSWLPPGFDHVFFTSGGSESADSAVRLARAFHVAEGRPERWKIVGRHPSYHGITLAAMSVASHLGRQRGFEPLLTPFPKVPWDDPAGVVEVIEREGPETIAAFVFEPITGAAGGCLMASDDYWRTVAETCRAHGILLVADEVMTGFGRTGRTWGHQHLPIEPDVLYGGKGLGGGYVPMGMVATTNRVAAPLAAHGGFMFFTFTGGDAMCAGADKVLEILEREQLVERSAKLGEVLGDKLAAALGDHPHVAEIRGRGLFRGIELVAEREPHTPFDPSVRAAARVVEHCLADDVWVYPAGSGPVQDAIMLGPPFTVSEDELDVIVAALRRALDSLP